MKLGLGLNIGKINSLLLTIFAKETWLLTATGIPDSRTKYVWDDTKTWDDSLIWTE